MLKLKPKINITLKALLKQCYTVHVCTQSYGGIPSTSFLNFFRAFFPSSSFRSRKEGKFSVVWTLNFETSPASGLSVKIFQRALISLSAMCSSYSSSGKNILCKPQTLIVLLPLKMGSLFERSHSQSTRVSAK